MNKHLTKRLMGLLLALVLLMSNAPATAFAMEETEATQPAAETISRAVQTELEATIEQQVRAFAKSINKSNADDTAAGALAIHGIGGGGKKLNVSSSHALTATLMNSELGLATVIRGCTAGIRVMQQLGRESVFDYGGCNWGANPVNCSTTIYPSSSIDNEGALYVSGWTDFTGKTNAYDSSLEWIVASTQVYTTITRGQVTADTVTYNVTVDFWDRFDFNTISNSGFKNLISGLGALLFKEFDWSATVKFSVTVPNACSHNSDAYYWRYDAAAEAMVCVTTDEFSENQTERLTQTGSTGTDYYYYYYELDRTVTLLHDVPWELEYTVKNPGTIWLSPTQRSLNAYYDLAIHSRTHFFIQNTERTGDTYKYHCYGYTLANLFNFAKDQLFTVRLENVIEVDGSNMIYISVYNHDLQKTVMEPMPMDDYYWTVNGVLQLQNTESRTLSGVDLQINYIGNKAYRFSADHFELRIWENGANGGKGDYFDSNVTNPTCTAQGYTTHTCSLCGYSYKDTYVSAKGHSYGGWTQVKAPNCTAAGEEQRSCTTCKESETRAIAALGHDVVQHPGLAPTCTEDGWSDYESCNRCDHSSYQAVSAKGHDYGSEVTPPSCTEDGYTTHTCACGDSYADTYVTALGHDMGDWITTDEPTCTETGSKRKDCSRCDHFETEAIPATGHSHEATATPPTCTEDGYTTHTCACGDSYIDDEVSALGHDMGQWTVITEPFAGMDGEEQRSCSRCDHYETRPIEYTGNLLKLEGEDLLSQSTVYINGLPYPVITVGEEHFVELPSEEDCTMVTYTYHVGDPDDIHTQYPVGMKVYMISEGEITYIEEFDNLLQYSGSSIRVTGNKGIRMITSLYKDTKSALTGGGLAGFTLVEYGTVLAFAHEVEGDGDLVLGKPYSRSNYAYKKGVADPVFANSGDLTQYTNVLVGFNLDQCKEDIAMRPYIILENADGEQFTIYGGTIYRSIGYVAYQNRNVVKAGTAAYSFVWDIIHHVYGDQFDEDYNG